MQNICYYKEKEERKRKMIDYLKLEASLKKFFDYEAQKESEKKVDKNFKKRKHFVFWFINFIAWHNVSYF